MTKEASKAYAFFFYKSKERKAQGDLIMSDNNAIDLSNNFKAKNAPSTLPPNERIKLAVGAITGQSTITQLAEEANTSRKFIYSQKKKAEKALDNSFPRLR